MCMYTLHMIIYVTEVRITYARVKQKETNRANGFFTYYYYSDVRRDFATDFVTIDILLFIIPYIFLFSRCLL